MKPFLASLFFCLWLALSAWSQTTTFQQPLSQVRQFLGLTDSQVSAIRQNNNDYNTFFFQQQQQIQHAQTQIAVETAKDSLDAMALGTLYAGIESACRDLRDQAGTSQTQNISVLTDAQKAKLSMLNEAMKLAPVISEARSENLLGSPTLTPFAFSSFIIGGFTSVIGFPTGVSGCGPPANIIPIDWISPVVPAGSQSDTAGMNETAAPAGQSGRWFTRKFVESNPAPRQ